MRRPPFASRIPAKPGPERRMNGCGVYDPPKRSVAQTGFATGTSSSSNPASGVTRIAPSPVA